MGKGNAAGVPRSRLPYNWRVHQLRDAKGAHFLWSPVVARRWRGRAKARRAAKVIDLRDSGAQVVAPFDARVRVGTHVQIEAAGGRGVALVQQMAEDDDPTMARYDVRFVALDDALQKLIDQTIVARRPEDAGWSWYATEGGT
jgi:hypothetical protein